MQLILGIFIFLGTWLALYLTLYKIFNDLVP